MDEKILEAILDIKKELKDIRSILEPPKFVPEDSSGKIYSDEMCGDIEGEKIGKNDSRCNSMSF